MRGAIPPFYTHHYGVIFKVGDQLTFIFGF
jgi:hypothetical protein